MIDSIMCIALVSKGMLILETKKADCKVWGFPKIRYFSGGPYNKDYSILGSSLRSEYFWKVPFPSQQIGWSGSWGSWA